MKNRNIFVKNHPLAEAKELWLQALEGIDFGSNKAAIQSIPVDTSLGYRLAEPVFAIHSSPSYNAAAMDGIAVHFADLAQASEASPVHLGKGKFMPVNTGNALPEGFDAVVMIEDVHYVNDEEVELAIPATPWQHVRTIGEDIVATELILPEGHKVRPIDQGAMLATGVTQIKVRRPPKVQVIPTGSELIQPGQVAKPGQIIEFIEECCLARAVGADEAEDLAGLDRETDVADSHEAPEGPGHAVELEDGVHQATSVVLRRRETRRPAMPWGR